MVVDLPSWLARRLVLLGLAFAAVAVPVGGYVAHRLDPSFDASAWRDARAEEDLDAQETQARRLVDHDPERVLGADRAEVRELLGTPDRVGRKRHLWIWDLGMIDDYAGPGDGGALYVQFAGPQGEATRVDVRQTFSP